MPVRFWRRVRPAVSRTRSRGCGAVLALALAAGGAPLGSAASKVPQLPAQRLYGQNFISLRGWADAQRLTLRWDKPSGEVWLTNRAVRVHFTVDSRRAEYNGVRVWLSLPLTPYQQRLYLGQIDIQTVFRPLVEPPRHKSGRKIRAVVLDPGHGGKDPGNQEKGEQEKKHTLLLAQELRGLLRAAGLGVTLTRTSDTYPELPDRIAVANRRKADLFVSLHYNSARGNEGAKGVEVYCLTPAGAHSTNARGDESTLRALPGNANNARNLSLAYQIQAALVRSLEVEDRGVRRARFAVLRDARMPAVLIEGGFMSAPAEAQGIYDAARRAELARAITDGILAYKRLVER